MQFSEDFFSFEGFPHRALWDGGQFVWSALDALLGYLKSAEKKIEIAIPASVHLVHPELIAIGEGTVLEPGAMIEGPCILGKRCKVGHGALLRGGVLCGDFCAIGHSAEIKHSILLPRAHATHLVYVGDSILGARVNLGAGVKCANLRLDRQPIRLTWRGEKFETERRKMGAILGDDAQIGCNCVLNPGTLVGKGSLCPPLIHLGGEIAPHSRIRSQRAWSAPSGEPV